MSTDILYPLLIGAGCLILVVLVHLLTRSRPSRDDIAVPQAPVPSTDDQPGDGVDVAALANWHRTHEAIVLGFFEAHDAIALDADDAGSEPAPPFDGEAFEEAVDAHPSPEMRAELAAARIAAESLALAQEREDEAALERHTDVYMTYREAWLDRLWQFCADHERVAALRGRDVGPPD